MRMQPAPTTSGYGLGYTPTTPLRPEAGNSFVPAADNVHDIWWTQRRARQRVRAGMAQGAPAAKPEPPVALDQAGVEQVLTEFVQSMYAATLFRNFRCEPTDYGQIAGMFEFVQLERGGVVLKLKRTFGEQNTALLDRMALYLRARIPQMQSIRVMHRDGQDIY